METTNNIVKVYSNNSKKARLKRNKNKFQRIWDAEKQTYVKVRKSKYPAKILSVKVEATNTIKIKMNATKRRKQNEKKNAEIRKSVPVTVAIQKPETKQKAHVEPARVHKHEEGTKVTRIHSINYSWDSKTLRYKRAA